MSIIEERDTLIKKWIKEAAEDIKEALDSELDIETKSAPNDLVTNMDKKIEEDLTKKIREHFPEDHIIGEEGFGDDLEDLSGTVWFIDPIDGTLNFVLQQEKYAVMIGVYEDGVGQQGYIYNVADDKLYYAIKGQGAYCDDQQLTEIPDLPLEEGMAAINTVIVTNEDFDLHRSIADKCMGIRMLGSAGIEAMELAKGNVVTYMASKLKPWDIAPGKVIIEELGGVVSQFNGEPVDLLNQNKTVFATKEAHKEIVELLNK